MDRLLLELKLPPADAYFKLVHTLEEVRVVVVVVVVVSRKHLVPAGSDRTSKEETDGSAKYGTVRAKYRKKE